MENNMEDLRHIRSMMERSTKFLSLSGLSGISAGVFALLGALLAYFVYYEGYRLTDNLFFDLLLDAVFVFILAGLSGLYFSYRKAKKSHARFWMPTTHYILVDFSIPMVAGGIFCLLLLYHQNTQMLVSSMLVFYGLALINAGSRTYRDIKILGACEIVLGILAGIFTSGWLLFWTIGFGVMHIIYGIVMYCKYDTAADKNG